MDTEKSQKFYLERYYKALKQFGENSLTVKICKKKLALLREKASNQTAANNTSKDEDSKKEETS